MKISEIAILTNSRVVSDMQEDKIIEKAFSSDLMSDVLTLDDGNILLITGLANIQLIRTAEMADIEVVLLARGKKAADDMIQLANENGLVILETSFSLFRASGILYSNGLKPVY
ncbi:MAG: hypothetical protein ACOCVA_06975 [Prolixibacteraceae bacterium]